MITTVGLSMTIDAAAPDMKMVDVLANKLLP